MLSQRDRELFLILTRKLNWNIHIIDLIIQKRNEIEMDEIKDYYIEKDFYNWLNHDLKTRALMDTDRFSFEKLDRGIVFHYGKFYSEIGVNNGYRRVRSLSQCFKSKWWKYTAKNNMEWKLIHKIIRSDIVVYKSRDEMEFYETDSLTTFNNDWIKVPKVKSISVINDYYNHFISSYHFLFEKVSFIFTDNYLNPFYIE